MRKYRKYDILFKLMNVCNIDGIRVWGKAKGFKRAVFERIREKKRIR